ncbi:MUT7 Exonuclease, partial [Amia calva]|nr:MUT7 Exonuclease [Amia calva]
FSTLGDPLWGLLTILESCPGTQKGKGSSLGHCVLIEFQRWRESNPQASLQGESVARVRRLQVQALGLLNETQPSFIDPFLDIFQLHTLDRDLLLGHVEYLLTCGSYKEAVLLSGRLELQSDLDMEQVCVPLILLDKLPLAEMFVSGHPELQQRLVRLLDSWCSLDFNTTDLFSQYPQLLLSQHCVERLHPKILSKQVFRLMDLFSIDPALCPNAVTKRRMDSLKFLMYKTFREKSMSEENWTDHVQTLVDDSVELQCQLVSLLVRYDGLQSAARWAQRYCLPRDRLPFGVWDHMESQPSHTLAQPDVPLTSTATWDHAPGRKDNYYQLPVPKDCIHFLDTAEGLGRCQEEVLKPGVVVGVDMEWRPTFGSVSRSRVALIQLAVQGSVFLLDLCKNGGPLDQARLSLLSTFIRALFSDASITKLGYGMSGDLRSLSATWPQFTEEPLEVSGMLDLLTTHQQLQRACRGVRRWPRGIETREGPAEKGLSLLVQMVLGKPLDKTEQLSNWERRPLRASQLQYAANDAYCLLEVFHTLSEDPTRFGLPPDFRSAPTDQPGKGRPKEGKRRARDKQKQPKQKQVSDRPSLVTSDLAVTPDPMTPQQLHVVCDNMLQGLGRYLRCVGVDVRMLENNDDHRRAAEIARGEGRIILTCGQPYQTLKSQVGEGRCVLVDCSERARDQALRVLRHFHIQVTHADVFSRCQACNGDQYMKLPRKDMEHLMRERGLIPTQQCNSEKGGEREGVGVGEREDGHQHIPGYGPQCRWAPVSDMDPQTLAFPSGASLQLHTIPPGLLCKVELFYVCTGCGKVFWEGSHFERVVTQFREVLKVEDP